VPCEREVDLNESFDQKVLLKRGFKMGRLIVTIPTIVSRTPLIWSQLELHDTGFRVDNLLLTNDLCLMLKGGIQVSRQHEQ
jgi:hypothetical protein